MSLKNIKKYYPNNQLKYEWTTLDDVYHGIDNGWYENGQIFFKYTFFKVYGLKFTLF